MADPRRAAGLLSDAADAVFDSEMPDAVAETAGLLTDLARQPEADEVVRFLADLVCGDAAWDQGDPERAMFLVHRAIARLDASPALSGNPGHQIAISNAWSIAGKFGKARQCAERAIELAQTTGACGRSRYSALAMIT